VARLGWIYTGSSTRFSRLTAEASQEKRNRVCSQLKILHDAMFENLSAKWSIYDMLPHSLMGCFGGEISEDLFEPAIAKAKQCWEEMQTAIDNGREGRVARAARITLGTQSGLRVLFRKFKSGDFPSLRCFPPLFVQVQELALAPTSARKVEEPHAQVSRFLSTTTHVLPASTCAALRREQNLRLIDNSESFFFILSRWRGYGVAAKVLKLTGVHTKGVSTAKLLPRVYRYKLADQFKKLEPQKKALETLQAHKKNQEQQLLKLESRYTSCLHPRPRNPRTKTQTTKLYSNNGFPNSNGR